MKSSIAALLATFLVSAPVVAVVTHHRDRQQLPPSFTEANPKANRLVLYAEDGSRIAFCLRDERTEQLTSCHTAEGRDLNDVMNAWLRAYKDR